MRELAADIVVIGGGPAGLEAACAAARALACEGRPASPGGRTPPMASASAAPGPGRAIEDIARVVLVDSGLAPGGQAWRARHDAPHPDAQALAAEAATAGVRLLSGRQVVGVLAGSELLLDGAGDDGQPRRLRWRRLVLATGARERLLPFPGWTLPGVFGAGGLQALAKGGWPVAGQRVVVAGTGPLLLAAAALLQREGARVVQLVEEATWGALARFGATLATHPVQAGQALQFAAGLAGVRLRAGWRVVEAQGTERLERVVLAPVHGAASAAIEIACDALAASWGLVPETGLARLLDCEIVERSRVAVVRVDATGRTSRHDVFAAGEATGVAGARAARIAGRRAGEAAALDLARPPGQPPLPVPASAALAREQLFAAAVSRCFPPPRDLASRLTPQTLVCRCEDVTWEVLRKCESLRAAKLETRCGMGHCQGRLCHGALALITGTPLLEPRLPLFPVDIGVLLACDVPPVRTRDAQPAATLEPMT